MLVCCSQLVLSCVPLTCRFHLFHFIVIRTQSLFVPVLYQGGMIIVHRAVNANESIISRVINPEGPRSCTRSASASLKNQVIPGMIRTWTRRLSTLPAWWQRSVAMLERTKWLTAVARRARCALCASICVSWSLSLQPVRLYTARSLKDI